MNGLQKERKTITVMIQMFCDAHHGAKGQTLCVSCQGLRDYANERLNRCPFGENKGACANCEIHCYKPEMRKRVTDVMRYSGPRMLTKHPLLAIAHLLKGRFPKRTKKVPKVKSD